MRTAASVASFKSFSDVGDERRAIRDDAERLAAWFPFETGPLDRCVEGCSIAGGSNYAGLFLRSFKNLVTLDTGFDRSNILIIETDFQSANGSADSRAMLSGQILQRLRSLPGAISVSESVVTPISGYMWALHFTLPNGEGPKKELAGAYVNFVSPGYFATLRTAIFSARDFDEHDIAGAQPVVVISETMAQRFFPRTTAIGQYLITEDYVNHDHDKKTPPMLVVGVVKDTKYRRIREKTAPTIYMAVAQNQKLDDPRSFEIRTAADPQRLPVLLKKQSRR